MTLVAVSNNSVWCLVQERVEAARAFGVGAEAPAPTFDPEEDLAEAEAAVGAAPAVVEVPSKGPTSAQLTSIKAAIANAATLDEVQRLENALKTGNVPSEFQVGCSINQTSGLTLQGKSGAGSICTEISNGGRIVVLCIATMVIRNVA